MRVLLVHNGADLYGASRSFLRLCARLVQDGNELLAVLPFEGPLLAALKAAGVTTTVLKPLPVIERRAFRSARGVLRMIWQSPVSVIRFCRLIRTFRPDLVHSNLSVLYTPAIAARLQHKPHVWHIRESYAGFGRFWRIYRRFMRWGADRIIAVSDAMAGQFGERLSKVITIHNGFPIEEFAPLSEERVEAFRSRYAISEGVLVGLVGRIKWERKGQEYLVEAASLLQARFPQVQYVLIGSPFPGNEDHLERLQAHIVAQGVGDRVIVTGDVEDIKAAYAAMDILVLASGTPEPFGGVVIEAMAMGKPVVGTAIGGTVEQIVDGVTGILVPPRDPNALADALASLLAAPERRTRMGAAGRLRYEACFSFEPFYQRIVQLYREVGA